MKTIILDIESDGLIEEWEDETATKIHCIVAKEIGDSQNPLVFTDPKGFNDYLSSVDCIICHNVICYDLPLLKKLGWVNDYTIEPDTINGKAIKIIDTYVLSRLLNPIRERHGLEWWGKQLGIIKPEIKDWTGLTLGDYIHRCTEDVHINEKVYNELTKEAAGHNWKDAYTLEKKFQDVMYRAETYGVLFNKQGALELLDTLDSAMTGIEKNVNAQLPYCELPASKVKSPPALRYKKDGTPGAHAVNYFGDCLEEVDGEFKVAHPNGIVYDLGDQEIPPLVGLMKMTIENQKEIKDLLLDKYKWKPTLWNFKKDRFGKKVRKEGGRGYETTSPRFNDAQTKEVCSDLERIGRKVDWVNHLCSWLVLRHRRNLVGSPAGAGYVNHKRLEIDSRLPAGMDTIGAATSRVTHRVVANLPRVATLYGSEIRSLFCVPVGSKAVGYDASSLEDVLKAHYVYKYDKGDYAFRIGQPGYSAHTENAGLWGIDRSQAKTGGYALQFECSLPTFCKAVGVDKVTGEQWYNSWWDLNFGLKLFREAAVHFWNTTGEKKWVLGLDGRKVPCKQEYMVVSRIIQSAGAIVMKRAGVIMDRWVKEKGLDANMVVMYHDEYLWECHPYVAELIAELGVRSITEAAKYYNLKVEITGEAKIGDSWAAVH